MTNTTFHFLASDEADTNRLGAALAKLLTGGTVVALNGPLGAGKTRLVQAIAAARGVDRGLVVSPTFVLVHEYPSDLPIYHVDAYRLRDEDDFLQLGVDEYFCPPNLVLIEWAERIARCLPPERIEITIVPQPADARQFEITGYGVDCGALVEKLRAGLSSSKSA